LICHVCESNPRLRRSHLPPTRPGMPSWVSKPPKLARQGRWRRCPLLPPLLYWRMKNSLSVSRHRVANGISVFNPQSNFVTCILSHLISGEKPNASHMCAKMKLHTCNRQKNVISLTIFKSVSLSLTTYYTQAGDTTVSNNGKR
jgi:hypothetical protein